MSRKNKTQEAEEVLTELREACHNSLWVFAQTINPHMVYGECHRELFNWMQQCELEGIDNFLALMPRDHLKSHCAAVWATWQIYKDPATSIIYVCATQDLAIKQLYAIKNMLTSEPMWRLAPDMVNERDTDREKWSELAIMVDHPKRKEEGVRDPTVQAAGIDSNLIGAHCRIMVKDDVVIDKNSETESARMKVASKAGHLSSILTTDGMELVVGTRYHPKDHYQDLIDMVEEDYDDDGELIGTRKVYAVHQRVVEQNGIFLWPRMSRDTDGKIFGFDKRQLARKKAKYGRDVRNFYCQYYNDPNAINTGGIERQHFEYYDRGRIEQRGGHWYYGDKRLNIAAAVDFAYSLSKGADATCIIVLGIDADRNYYVLDIDRFHTKQPSVYWQHVSELWLKWQFRYLRAEAVAAQEVIIEALKDYCTQDGYNLKIRHYKPNWTDGTKEERISQTLEPLYDQGRIYHYKGGLCSELEDELVMDRPPHDDIKDTLHIAVSFDKLKPPPPKLPKEEARDGSGLYAGVYSVGHSRFGGLG